LFLDTISTVQSVAMPAEVCEGPGKDSGWLWTIGIGLCWSSTTCS